MRKISLSWRQQGGLPGGGDSRNGEVIHVVNSICKAKKHGGTFEK